MKFIAILKDSLRETLDVKLFYVMVGLSLLTVLLAASVTYRPVEVEDSLNFNLKLLNGLLRAQPEAEGLNFKLKLEDFQRLDSRKEPWLGDYRFDYVATFTLDENADPPKGKRGGAKELKRRLKQVLKADALEQQFRQLFREVEVKEQPPTADLPQGTEELRFRVIGRGTQVKSRQEWYHEPALFFGLVKVPVPMFKMSQIITFIVTWVIGTFGAAFTLLLSVVLTASFLPSMLAKGTIDMLLVKPIHRVTLFVYKYLGGLLFMLLNTAVIMVGLYVAIGVQTGVWLQTLLVLILVYTLQFAVLYSVSALMAVLTRSAIVCILMAMLTWVVLFALGWAQWGFIENRREGAPGEASLETRRHWAFVSFDALTQLAPRYKEIDWLGNKMLEEELIQVRATPPAEPGADAAENERLQKRVRELYEEQKKALDKRYGKYNWTTSLLVTSTFIVVVLGLACLRFVTKDY